MLRTRYLTCLLIGMVTLVSAQDSVNLTFAYKPVSVYQMKVKNNVRGNMDIQVPDSLRQALGGSLDGFPMDMEMFSTIPITITTGELSPDGAFPATLAYGVIETRSILNGESEEQAENPLSERTIYGRFSGGKSFALDSISGGGMDQVLTGTLKGVLEQMERFMVLPENPIVVGVPYPTEVPMEFPMAGMNPLKMNIQITYTLTSIGNGRAYFDLDQELAADTEQEQFDMRIEGSGTGSGVFNIRDGYWESISTELPVHVELLMTGGLRVVSDMNTLSEVNANRESGQ